MDRHWARFRGSPVIDLSFLPLAPTEIALGFFIMATASAVQGYVGLGISIVAAPLLLMLNPAFVPGPLLASGLLLTVLIVGREHRAIRWQGIGFCFFGRLFGIAPALWMLTHVSQRAYDLSFGVLVLLAVALSLIGRGFTATAPRLWGAGVASGFMGTLSSIGGPPLALVYQHSPPVELRATLSLHFIVGGTLAIAGLASVGRFGGDEVVLATVLLPGVAVGFAVSRWLLRHTRQRNARPAVLALAACAGLIVLVRAALA